MGATMSKPKYFVLSFSEDGDVSLKVLDAAGLQKHADDYWSDEEMCPKFLDKIDPNGVAYTVGTMIIKGEVVKPRPVDIVKKWGID